VIESSKGRISFTPHNRRNRLLWPYLAIGERSRPHLLSVREVRLKEDDCEEQEATLQ
jgi:hypothetical protein